ncbi:MAG: calcium/sodium antiporter [Gammaproteobacteria bacterium]|nr:calcium/sodium antiporter [Gammaproteobacteria bacterium]
MVVGSSVTARNLGVSPMIVGLTVVGFATSAPEILVSVMAAIDGVPNLAIGNAIGSNIANIGLVAGMTALAWPLQVNSLTLRWELPAMFAVSILPVTLLWDDNLSQVEGLLLICAFDGFIYWIIRLGQRTRDHDTIEAEFASEIPIDMQQNLATLWIIAGLFLLTGGSKALVWGAENIARELEITNTILGITVVAVGTSLPELAVSILAARKGEHGLAVGNIIGSNSFNMLVVSGIAAAIRPVALDITIVSLHFPVMLAFTAAFFFMAYNYTETIRISRRAGAILLISFIAYHAYVAVKIF